MPQAGDVPRVLRRLVGLLLALPVVAAAAQPSSKPFDRILDQVVARYHLPGIALGVIEDGQVVYVGTRGERVLGSGRKVDADTLFKIASNSKAMTATVLARLVQQGKLAWDDPVRKHLPGFAMHDPWVSEHMQVGDLLVHHSGLPEGGGDLMLWPTPNRFQRADIIHGLRYIKPAYDFRAGYAYDNLLYVVAGEVAAAAGGADYASLVRREIFQPLGMTRCQVGRWDRQKVGNVARPHNLQNGRFVPLPAAGPVIEPSTMEAAGGIRCSLTDMLTWARNWLAPDARQRAWLTPAQRQKEWTPYTPMPISERRRRWDDTRLYAYGYGWRLADADGELSVSHTGTLSGMYSALTLLPRRKSGFVFLINGDAGAARQVLNQVLVNHFTRPANARSLASYADELAAAAQRHQHTQVPDTSARKPASRTELQAWLGVWRDPWFGDIRLCPRAGGVHFASVMSPTLEGPVMRIGSRYLVQWAHGDAEAWLGLPERPEGALQMSKVDPGADFSYDFEDLAFTRVADCAAGPAPAGTASQAPTASP